MPGKDSKLFVLEILEVRKFLSIVNIADFGANPNGGNDSPALQAAMNSAQDGDTIFFPRGTYNFDSTVFLRGNLKYVGDNNTTLTGDPGTHIFHISQDNIDIENFTFNGNALMIDKPNNQMVQNLTVNGNLFEGQATGSNNNAITFTTGLRNSAITNNSFGPLQTDNGIYGYYWDNLTIANNEFIGGNEGIHVTDFGNVSKNLLLEQNYFSGLRRMGIELQGGGDHSVVQDNYYENPVMTNVFAQNTSVFAYSIIADQSENNIVRRNTAVTLDRPDGAGCRVGIEIGGDNTLVTDNYIIGTQNVLESNDGNGTTSVLAKNNRWGGYMVAPYGNNLTLVHNGPDVALDWNISRGKPGPFKWLTSTDEVPVSKSTDDLVQSISQVIAPQPKFDLSAFTYLSDLQIANSNNSWGPVELDQTNGGEDANDGTSIKLDGKIYNKGLGVAGNSEIDFNLNGLYTWLFSDLGIDDTAGDDGSATFQIYADGTKVFDSGVMKGGDAKQGISLDVTGIKQLQLITTNGGDGNQSDMADWAAPRLLPIDLPV